MTELGKSTMYVLVQSSYSYKSLHSKQIQSNNIVEVPVKKILKLSSATAQVTQRLANKAISGEHYATADRNASIITSRVRIATIYDDS